MRKIVLDGIPDDYWDLCPFMKCPEKTCILNGYSKCMCIEGPYYSEDFNFNNCKYCTTNENN